MGPILGIVLLISQINQSLEVGIIYFVQQELNYKLELVR